MLACPAALGRGWSAGTDRTKWAKWRGAERREVTNGGKIKGNTKVSRERKVPEQLTIEGKHDVVVLSLQV